MSDKPTAKTILEERFQQLVEDRKSQNEMPAGLRKEVFKTLDQVDEVDDVTELFSGDCTTTKPEFFDRIEPLKKAKE